MTSTGPQLNDVARVSKIYNLTIVRRFRRYFHFDAGSLLPHFCRYAAFFFRGLALPDVKPEICASGFRNPFRCSFDRETDVLYCGDVGHTNVEEIDIVEWAYFDGYRRLYRKFGCILLTKVSWRSCWLGCCFFGVAIEVSHFCSLSTRRHIVSIGFGWDARGLHAPVNWISPKISWNTNDLDYSVQYWLRSDGIWHGRKSFSRVHGLLYRSCQGE